MKVSLQIPHSPQVNVSLFSHGNLSDTPIGGLNSWPSDNTIGIDGCEFKMRSKLESVALLASKERPGSPLSPSVERVSKKSKDINITTLDTDAMDVSDGDPKSAPTGEKPSTGVQQPGSKVSIRDILAGNTFRVASGSPPVSRLCKLDVDISDEDVIIKDDGLVPGSSVF
ncbi:hypothetical protein V6N13_024223 [Hibiscus sabdariffa]|uniref:Uncharacterized protein n=1 Tax=Hibiscus sabdariffa TaxID=183260 RepID=A0ABR2BWT3_9ROSI